MLAIRFLLFLTAVMMLCGTGARATVPLPAAMTETVPTLDGDLSDECWQSAVKLAEFFHRESGAPASEQTTAWICYDEKYIYVAFDCRDSQPDQIRAQQTKRGGAMWEDDHVCFIIDPFSEYRWSALNHFRVNILGTQTHNVQSAETGKTEWAGDWDSAVKRHDGGYSVEMRIPFAILKYDWRKPNISLAFVRSHARLGQEFWAPNTGKNGDLTNIYFWDGAQLPAVRPKPVTMLYSMVGTGSGDSSARAGLDFKHAITPSLSGLIAVNPDFRNVEQEVDSVDFSYTERTVDDTRPFFREGSQYFPGSRICYTRRIGEIDAGAKIVGLVGKTKIAAMNTRTFGGDSHTVSQVGRQFGPNGDYYAWFGGAHSDTETGSYLTTFTTIGGLWRHSERSSTNINFDYINTGSSADTSHGYRHRLSFSSNNGPRKIEYYLARVVVDDDYKPHLGIIQDTDLRATEAWFWIGDTPGSGGIKRWQMGLGAENADRPDGSRFYNYLEPYGSISWRNGGSLGLSYLRNHRLENNDAYWTIEYGWGENDIYRAGALECSFGKVVGGDYSHLSLEQGFRLSDRLSAQVWWDYRRISQPSAEAGTYRQTVLSAAYDISSERGIVGRLIRLNGKSNVYFAYRQHVRAGLDAYLIYGDPNAGETRDTILLKLVRPM